MNEQNQQKERKKANGYQKSGQIRFAIENVSHLYTNNSDNQPLMTFVLYLLVFHFRSLIWFELCVCVRLTSFGAFCKCPKYRVAEHKTSHIAAGPSRCQADMVY